MQAMRQMYLVVILGAWMMGWPLLVLSTMLYVTLVRNHLAGCWVDEVDMGELTFVIWTDDVAVGLDR